MNVERWKVCRWWKFWKILGSSSLMWWNTFSFTCRSILWNIASSHYTFDSTSKNVSLEGAFECRTSQNGWSSVTSHRCRFWIGCTISALPSQSVLKETKHTGSFHEREIGEEKLYSISSVSVAYNQHTWYKYRMRTGGMIHTMLFAPMHLFCNKIAMVAWLEEKPADLKSEKHLHANLWHLFTSAQL